MSSGCDLTRRRIGEMRRRRHWIVVSVVDGSGEGVGGRRRPEKRRVRSAINCRRRCCCIQIRADARPRPGVRVAWMENWGCRLLLMMMLLLLMMMIKMMKYSGAGRQGGRVAGHRGGTGRQRRHCIRRAVDVHHHQQFICMRRVVVAVAVVGGGRVQSIESR